MYIILKFTLFEAPLTLHTFNKLQQKQLQTAVQLCNRRFLSARSEHHDQQVMQNDD